MCKQLIISTVSMFTLYCLLLLPYGVGAAMMAKIDVKFIKTSSGLLDSLKVSSHFSEACIEVMYASLS